jgi:hypothetical protein
MTRVITPDWIYEGMLTPDKCDTPDGRTYALAIERQYPPQDWKAQLELVPEAVRPEAVEYLRARYVLIREATKARKEREEREARGKKSAVGDAALAELARRYGAPHRASVE